MWRPVSVGQALARVTGMNCVNGSVRGVAHSALWALPYHSPGDRRESLQRRPRFSPDLGRAFPGYYTTEELKRALFECDRRRLDAMQSRGDRHTRRMTREYRNEGGTPHQIAQTASELTDQHGHIRQLANAVIGVYLHGTRTGALSREGRLAEAREHLKIIRGSDAQVGPGTHHPQVIQCAVEEGWELDSWMGCLCTRGHRGALPCTQQSPGNGHRGSVTLCCSAGYFRRNLRRSPPTSGAAPTSAKIGRPGAKFAMIAASYPVHPQLSPSLSHCVYSSSHE